MKPIAGYVGVAAFACVTLGSIRTAAAAGSEQTVAPAAFPTPPFAARVVASAAWIRASPGAEEMVGLVREGDRVTVRRCEPSCEARGAWAILDGDGAVKLSLLHPLRPDEAALPAERPRLSWGAVMRGVTPVYAEPRSDARIVHRLHRGKRLHLVVAFVPDEAAAARGFLRRVDGTFVPADRVRVDRPGPLRGEHDPKLPLAFLVREVRGTRTDGTKAAYAKYARFPIEGETPSGRIRIEGATLGRGPLRLAFARPRPPEVGPADKWVHVDLREQVLVAYEGDRPVFATLVAAGKDETPTRPGRFRVWWKTIHELMHGVDDPYWIEDVPFIQYFVRGQALHGAFWHDTFGRQVTHGCVNLSMADAEWLFAWAPPTLPEGWHAVMGGDAHPSLWVWVQKAAAERLPRADDIAPPKRPR